MRAGVRVLIFGYYGMANFGDEALLDALVGDLAAAAIDLDCVTVITHGHNASARTSRPALTYATMSRTWTIVKAVHRSDLLVVGGGSLLKDPSAGGGTMVLIALWPVVLASLIGRPVVYYSIGTGNIRHRRGRLSVRLLADLAVAAYVRDPASALLFGASRCPLVRSMPDALLGGFGLRAHVGPVAGVDRQSVLFAPSQSIASLRPEVGWPSDVLRCLVQSVEGLGNPVGVAVFQGGPSGDAAMVTWAAQDGVPVEDFSASTFAEAIERLARWDVVVTDRLHAAEAAITAGCRVVIRPSDQKLRDLASELKLRQLPPELPAAIACLGRADEGTQSSTIPNPSVPSERRQFLDEALRVVHSPSRWRSRSVLGGLAAFAVVEVGTRRLLKNFGAKRPRR